MGKLAPGSVARSGVLANALANNEAAIATIASTGRRRTRRWREIRLIRTGCRDVRFAIVYLRGEARVSYADALVSSSSSGMYGKLNVSNAGTLSCRQMSALTL